MAARKYEQLTEVDDLDASYQKWIYKQLEKRVVEYAQVDKVKIVCASWNVNAKSPSESDNLKEWLLPENTAAPDIYAIGLQEIVDLNVTNVVFKTSPSVGTSAAWVQRLSKILNEVDYYKVLLDKSMVGIMFVIFVKASLHSCIKDVKYALTYTGSYGVTGNKGGVSISMKIHDSPLCFVCAHFHANRDAVAARNLDYHLICENTEFISVGPEYSQDPDMLFMFPNASDSAPSSMKSSKQESNSNSPTRGRLASASIAVGSSGASLHSNSNTNSNSNGNSTGTGTTPAKADPTHSHAHSYTHTTHHGDATSSSASSTANPAFGVARSTNNPAFRRGSDSAALSSSSTNNSNNRSFYNNNNTPETNRKALKATRILEHEYVFWLGDLNYRIDEEVEIVEIFERLYNESWETLRAQDQLHQERGRKNVFHGFNEGLLSFPPTYKYQPGTDLYDTRPEKKLRAPAWCDRILWRSTRVDRDVTMLHYRAAPLNMSDHKPVSAMFICNTHKIVKEKLKEVYADLLHTVDKWINESKPKIECTNRLIDFGPIVYNKMYRAVMHVRNTGTVMAEWAFVPKHDAVVSKSWLKFSPMDGILAPDEQCEVEVLLMLNLEEAYEIATTKANLVDDIAIMRITNGSDLFCIVNACLTADTCAAVCSAFARAGNRQSADLRGVTSSGNANLRTVSDSTSSSGAGSNNNSTDATYSTNTTTFALNSTINAANTNNVHNLAKMHQTELKMDNLTLKISHAAPVARDKD